ncbi:hypothetical protein V8B55DRAFT_1520763 [Mucor lusitanicus]
MLSYMLPRCVVLLLLHVTNFSAQQCHIHLTIEQNLWRALKILCVSHDYTFLVFVCAFYHELGIHRAPVLSGILLVWKLPKQANLKDKETCQIKDSRASKCHTSGTDSRSSETTAISGTCQVGHQ